MRHSSRRRGQKTPTPLEGTAVIYARFSCSKQREASIDDQLRVCREWCQAHGYRVVATYSDYAMSGRTDDRPEFQRMIANAGESEIVLVYMMDRFSRDVYDAPMYKRKLRDRGVRVVSATEAMPDGPEAILIESVYEAMAAMESAHTSQRVRRGMEGNALKCLHNGDSLYGYGVGEDGHYVVNENEAPVVREVFERKAQGEPINAIARDLARRGIRTRTGGLATYGFVYNMIKREKYAGTYIWGDVRVEGGMPAIVTREQWTMANERRPRKIRESEDWGRYPLVPRGICRECGGKIVGVSGRGHSGAKYEYYRCAGKCGCKPVRADWLEAATVDAIRMLLSDREQAMRVARVIEEQAKDRAAEERIAAAYRREREARRGIERMMDAIAAGLDPQLAMEKVERLKAQAEAAAAEAHAIESASWFDAEEFADFLQDRSGLTDAQLLEMMVWQVWIGQEHIVVVLNYDANENEPARIDLERVRLNSRWWTIGNTMRTGQVKTTLEQGHVLVMFDRAA